jgi:hypothetical protein
VIALVVSGVLINWHPRIDVEPAAWFLHGYSVHVGVQPPRAPRLLLSAGAYAFDVPQPLVDLASGNRDEPWDVRLYLGAGVFADYFVGREVDRGWVIGGQLGIQQYEATLDGTGSRFTDALVLVRAGYEWHPWGYGGYVFPWVGGAFTTKVSGSQGEYDTIPVQPYLTVDLGWRM